MFGLMIKDMHVIVKYRLTYMLLVSAVLVLLLSAFGAGNNCAIIGLVFSSVEGTIGFDRSSEWEKFAVTLPVSRMQVVLSKYLLSVVLMFIGMALGLFVTVLFNAVLHLNLTLGDLMADVVTAVPIMLMLNAMVIMFNMRTSRFTVLAVLVGVALFWGLLGVFGYYFKFSATAVFSALLLASIVLYGVSFFLACLLYRRKDL